jgi:hypothetical protein
MLAFFEPIFSKVHLICPLCCDKYAQNRLEKIVIRVHYHKRDFFSVFNSRSLILYIYNRSLTTDEHKRLIALGVNGEFDFAANSN